jgi:hypothetical protein
MPRTVNVFSPTGVRMRGVEPSRGPAAREDVGHDDARGVDEEAERVLDDLLAGLDEWKRLHGVPVAHVGGVDGERLAGAGGSTAKNVSVRIGTAWSTPGRARIASAIARRTALAAHLEGRGPARSSIAS